MCTASRGFRRLPKLAYALSPSSSLPPLRPADDLGSMSATPGHLAPDMRGTIGAVVVGALGAVALSAIIGFQTFLYFHVFPMDAMRYKLLVVWIWLLDAIHTVFICVSIWHYGVLNFSNPAAVQHIFPTLSLNVLMTATITASVNLFYGWRIHKMSQRNWWLTSLIALLSFARIVVAGVSTVEMFIKRSFAAFAADFQVLLITGLALSAAADIVISLARYHFLRNLQQGYPGTQEAVDVVVIFTVNDGCLTCALVLTALICLLRMPHNFVWVGIYFCVAKLYSNSVLTTLNLRNWYKHRQRPMGIPLSGRPGTGVLSPRASEGEHTIRRATSTDKQLEENGSTVEVFVDQQVEYTVSVGVAPPPRPKKASRIRRPI